MKNILLFIVLAVFGCVDRTPHVYTYVDTEYGLVSYQKGDCVVGMLVSNSGNNILNVDKRPITCLGYVKLTKTEAEKYE